MIKPLRKKHLQIWIAWAVLLPILIISAVLVRPAFPEDKLLQPAASAALPIVLKSLDKENYSISIRSNSDTSQLQLEWINKKTLTYPTATIYKASPNPSNREALKDFVPEKSELIGRIEARGIYHFVLPNNNATIEQLNNKSIHFIIYDFIHQQIIDTINF